MSAGSPPVPDFPRLTAEPLPAYRFVPGRTPHPTGDPRGHSFGTAVVVSCAELAAALADWRKSPRFCRGVDLYNYGYWWEAHEAWEPLWRCCPLRAPPRRVLQGFIQVAAAHLQRRLGRAEGAGVLVARAARNVELACAAGASVHFGVDVLRWVHDAVEPYFTAPEARAYPFLRPGA